MYWRMFHTAGQPGRDPGISVNAGFDGDNLPIGLQLLGPWYREDVLLQTRTPFSWS